MANRKRSELLAACPVVLALASFLLVSTAPWVSATLHYPTFKEDVRHLRSFLFEKYSAEMGDPTASPLSEMQLTSRLMLLHRISFESSSHEEQRQHRQHSVLFSHMINLKQLFKLVEKVHELPLILARRTTLQEYSNLHIGSTHTGAKLDLEDESPVWDFTLPDSTGLALACKITGDRCLLDTVSARSGTYTGTQVMYATDALLYLVLPPGAVVFLTDKSNVICNCFNGNCELPIRLMWPLKGATMTWYESFGYQYTAAEYARYKRNLIECARTSHHLEPLKDERVSPMATSGEILKHFLQSKSIALLELVEDFNHYESEMYKPLGVLTNPEEDFNTHLVEIAKLYDQLAETDLSALIRALLSKSATVTKECQDRILRVALEKKVEPRQLMGSCSTYCDLVHMLYTHSWSKLPGCKDQIDILKSQSEMSKEYRL